VEAGPSTRKTIASVDRALRLLFIVAAASDGITAKVIARRLDANLSTTYHLLHTLTDRGLLVRLPESRGYGIGYGAVELHNGLNRQLSVTPEIADLVRRVHDQARAAACFAVFREGQIVIAYVAESPAYPMPPPLDVGFSDAPHSTAFGKVMLAHMPERDRARLIDVCGIAPVTDKTVSEVPALEAQLAAVRSDGIAVELEEFQTELACLAAPVRRSGSVIGAIAVGTRPASMLRRRDELENVVRCAATQASYAVSHADRLTQLALTVPGGPTQQARDVIGKVCPQPKPGRPQV
jgi:DNA-binding IclR family transcriptional regulator